ncbi:hypothetical protein [Microbulbifer variabilis]|uniref:hypothetical protein n=1 Tax=Microbulbifer variabilis TaxID=266805 RepID=UPI001CFD3F81|nr:hypothetical protein [Microbulbifer variabilis]
MTWSISQFIQEREAKLKLDSHIEMISFIGGSIVPIAKLYEKATFKLGSGYLFYLLCEFGNIRNG